MVSRKSPREAVQKIHVADASSRKPNGNSKVSAAPDLSVFNGLRVVVAMEDEVLGAQLTRVLERAGATVVYTHPSGDRLRTAAEIDPELVYVDADGLGARGMRLGRALQSNPRLRWAAVIRFSSHQLTDGGPKDPTLIRLAVESKPKVQIDVLLAERARRDPPFVVQLARVGPNRVLRALEKIDGPLRVTVTGPRSVAQMDLHSGRIKGVLWKEVKPARTTIDGLDALAAFLMLEHGDVRIERRDRATIHNLDEPMRAAIGKACARIPTVTETAVRMESMPQELDVALPADLAAASTDATTIGTQETETQRIRRLSDVPWRDAQDTHVDSFEFTELASDTVVSGPPSAAFDEHSGALPLNRAAVDVSDEAETRIVPPSPSLLSDDGPSDASETRVAANPTAMLGPLGNGESARPESTGPRAIFRDAPRSDTAHDGSEFDSLPTLESEPPREQIPSLSPKHSDTPDAWPERHARAERHVQSARQARPDRQSSPPATPLAGPVTLASVTPPLERGPNEFENDHPTFIRELPLVFRMPKLGDDRPPTGRVIDGLPKIKLEHPLHLGPTRSGQTQPVENRRAYDRLEPTEPVRFGRAHASIRPPQRRRVLLEDSRWIQLLPVLSFFFGLAAVGGAWVLARRDTATDNRAVAVTDHQLAAPAAAVAEADRSEAEAHAEAPSGAGSWVQSPTTIAPVLRERRPRARDGAALADAALPRQHCSVRRRAG
jgi:hypothetical protein